MANVNSTLGTSTPAKYSNPERLAHWLHQNSINWRPLLGFALVALLGYISLRFNYELGKLSAVDETSKSLLPYGYALLDLCCLFLAGYVGIRSRSLIRKCIAWVWFAFLLSLSLWAAASFTLAIDAQQESRDLTHAIEQKKIEVESLNQEVEIWRQNVAEAIKFKTKHQNTLREVQARQTAASDELHALESELIPPTMAIYAKAAPLLGLSIDTLNLVIRLCWSAAVTLSPLILSLIGYAEFIHEPRPDTSSKKKDTLSSEKTTKWSSWSESFKNWRNRRKVRRFLNKTTMQNSIKQSHEERQTKPEKVCNRASQPEFVAPVEKKRGHNQHTDTLSMNGLKYVKQWLETQPAGRVTRSKIGFVSKVKTREGVTKIINALLEQGLLKQSANGHFSKPEQPPKLRLISNTIK